MDRSLVQMERSPIRIAGGAGTTMTTRTTPPRNGTVVAVRHARNTQLGASGHGVRAFRECRTVAVPMKLVRARRTMPAADVTRNWPSQRPFAKHAPNPMPQGVHDVSNEDINDDVQCPEAQSTEAQSTKAQPMAMRAAKKVAKKAAPKKKAAKKAAPKKAAAKKTAKKAAPKKAGKKAAPKKKAAAKKTAKKTTMKKAAPKKTAKKAAPKKAAVKKSAVKKAAPKKAMRKTRKSAMPPMDSAPASDATS